MVTVTVFVGTLHHHIVDSEWVADAKHGDAPAKKLLADPVDGGIAWGAHQYLCLALQGLADGLDECGGLTGARRAVNNGSLASAEYFGYGCVLAGVEPRDVVVVQVTERGLSVANEHAAKVDKIFVAAVFHLSEAALHHLIAIVVDA